MTRIQEKRMALQLRKLAEKVNKQQTAELKNLARKAIAKSRSTGSRETVGRSR